MTEIFLHEDFIKQIELIPAENQFSTTVTLDSMNEGVGTSSEYGWYEEIIERIKPKTKIESRSISIKELDACLIKSSLSSYKKVISGYSKTILKNTYSYIYERIALFVEFSNQGIVTSIFLYTNSLASKEMENAKFPLVLNHLGGKYNLVLVDWDEEILVRIESEIKTNKYLSDCFGFLPI